MIFSALAYLLIAALAIAALAVFMLPVYVCVCRNLGGHIALSKEIDGEFCRTYKMAPQREWEPVVHSAEDCYKMIFEGLDGSFGHVSPVAIRWD